jgi:uronate dehydrogenase
LIGRCKTSPVDAIRGLRKKLRPGNAERPWPRPPRPLVPGARVLVTGASGAVGGVLLAGLKSSHAVRGIDMRAGDHTDRLVDMRRLGDVVRAFAGIDTVVDLAANSEIAASWEEVHANNLPATMNALEAARETGVRRVILASSHHIVGLAERDEPYASILAGRHGGLDPGSVPRLTVLDPVRPDGAYGVGKALGEAAGRYYAEEHGLSVLCLRIGTVNPADRPLRPKDYATFLSHRDLLALVRCCVAAPDSLRFGVYFGVSANRWRIWDIENAQRELGYEPVDDAEQWR